MKAVTEAVRATAKQHARAEHFKWVSAAVSIVSIMFLAVGWGENRRGQAQGLAAGESRAKAECAYATKLSSWALTPDGTRAYELEKLGSLHDLVSCSGRGLERKGDWCVAQSERGKSYRWRIAASERGIDSAVSRRAHVPPRRRRVEWLSPSRRWPIRVAVHTYSTNVPPISAE